MISVSEAAEDRREEYRRMYGKWEQTNRYIARVDEILQQVRAELFRAMDNFGSFHSRHEGYGVIKEELDELWDEIKANSTWDKCDKEATQLAAMAVRFLLDLDAK